MKWNLQQHKLKNKILYQLDIFVMVQLQFRRNIKILLYKHYQICVKITI